MHPDILIDLADLKKQATTERSHHYVAKCVERAEIEINDLRCALMLAKEKLKLYRSKSDGEYIGGQEYTRLMRQIDEVLAY